LGDAFVEMGAAVLCGRDAAEIGHADGQYVMTEKMIWAARDARR